MHYVKPSRMRGKYGLNASIGGAHLYTTQINASPLTQVLMPQLAAPIPIRIPLLSMMTNIPNLRGEMSKPIPIRMPQLAKLIYTQKNNSPRPCHDKVLMPQLAEPTPIREPLLR
ncbi:MAG: hypothetical protein BA863_07500 [Desulfovibrio sp. S3730MH75]|nr:MAG: hypothetical protein BA863_07500 [Desulfovibrio sp. S3730MH75]